MPPLVVPVETSLGPEQCDNFYKQISQVSMIENEMDTRYFENDRYQFLEIPYETLSFSMFLILPRERFGLNNVIKNIDISDLLNMMSTTTKQKVEITIPKFTVESAFDLQKTLESFGIRDAFDKNRANFTGIADRKLMLSKIIHKSVIKVMEGHPGIQVCNGNFRLGI